MRLSVLVVALSGAALAATFAGRVIDAESGEPVPLALLQVQPAGLTVNADSLGSFLFDVPDNVPAVTVAASRVGYEQGTWTDVVPSDSLELPLARVVFALSSGLYVRGARLANVPGRSRPVTVVTGSDLAPRGRTDIAGALGNAPAATLQDYGNLATVSLRGASAEQTLVMLDGVRLNSAMNNLTDLSLLSFSDAGRIAVIAGGSSALHGANALGGVVNLSTPEPDRASVSAGAGLGSYGQKSAGLSYADGIRPFRWIVGGNFVQADNRFPYRDALDSARTRLNSDLLKAGLLLKGTAELGEAHRLSLVANGTLSRRGAPGPLSMPTDSARQNDLRGIAIAAWEYTPNEDGLVNLKLYHNRLWQSFSNPAAYFAADDTHEVATTGVDLRHTRRITNSLLAFAGLESYREVAASTQVGSPARWTYAGWADFRYDVGKLSISPAVRADFINSAARTISSLAATSPRLALSCRLPGDMDVSAGLSRSFRAPTFNELHWPVSQFIAGNPGLRPERSLGFDAGIGGSRTLQSRGFFRLVPTHRYGWRVGGFYTYLTDLIQWQPGAGDTWRPVNVDTATTAGAEAALDVNWTHFGLNGNGQYLLARARGRDLPYRPRLSGRASVWVALVRVGRGFMGMPILNELARLALTARGSSARFADPANADTLPGYLLFDAEASASPRVRNVNVTVRAGCRNVLDRRYQSIKDYPVPGRTLYAEVEVGYAGWLLPYR
ncbi:TonB-dependent receptor [candidate division WOR-3 bacterium]|nr:TonB-dependent receptor [candidate division WOR-3 bacterium]